MGKLKSVLGHRFGMLTVIEEHQICRNRRVMCRCDCGEVVERVLAGLKRGRTKSCGCRSKVTVKTHGLIYYLLDPDTRAIRYIGETVQKPGARLREHVCNSKQGICKDKAEWILSLLPKRPEVFIAEEGVPVAEMERRERQHIACQLENGADLLNVHNAGEQTIVV